MNIRQLEDIATKLWGLFSLQQLQLYEPDFLRSNLIRRQKQWYIHRVTKWWYSLDISPQEHILYTYSNRIYTPSYISMESALRYYDLIPEWVYVTTACTSKKTQLLEWDYGVFTYSHVKPTLMRWYDIVTVWWYHFRIAQPQKAICDYIYLKPHLKTAQDIYDVRIDIHQLFSLTTLQDLRTCATLYHNKRVTQLIEFLILSNS